MSESPGITFPPYSPELRARAVRATTYHIRYLARQIRSGTHELTYSLQQIIHAAHVGRVMAPDGRARLPVESMAYWRICKPFFDIATRWETARKEGTMTPELAEQLHVEMYETALALVGDRGGPDGERKTDRITQVVQFYDKGHRLTEPRTVERYS